MKIKLIFSFLLLSIFSAGPCAARPITFTDVSEKVLQTNCTSCHSEAGGNRGDVNLETYAGVAAVLNDVQDDVDHGIMPPRRGGVPLTDDQKKLILDWIAQGAVESPAPSVSSF